MCDEFPSNLAAAEKQFRRSTKGGVEAARKFLASALFWLGHDGPTKLEAMLALPVDQRRTERFGTSPEIDLSRPVVVPKSSAGLAFAHDGDLAGAVQYHRVWQLLLHLWRTMKKVKGTSGVEKWDAYWRKEGLFSSVQIDGKFAPVWMRGAEENKSVG